MSQIVYKWLAKFFLTSTFVKKIEQQMLILYPSDRFYIQKKTGSVLLSLILSSIAIVGGLLVFGNIRFYYIMLIIGVLYVVVHSMIYEKFSKIETKLLIEFEKFITDVRFQFQYDGMIEEALQDAVNGADYEMAIHGQQIVEYLRGETDDGREGYQEVAPNAFFLTFYTLCETVNLFGDKEVDGQSSFLKNIGYIKEEINIEILNRKRTESMFMGLKSLAIFPVFAIKPIEVWSVSNIPELEAYYSGMKGSLVTAFVMILSLLIYSLINKLKYPESFYHEKSEWVTQILQIQVLEDVIMSHIGRHYKHYFKMDMMLKSIAYEYNVKEFIVKRLISAIGAGILCVVFMISIGMLKSNAIIKVFAVLIIILTVIATYQYFYVMLLFKRQLMRLERENEILRFQAVLLIVMHMEKMTIEQILNWIEKFAVVFRSDVERMNDQLCYKGVKVFEDAKQTVGFVPFERLLKSFQACDSIGIEKAFSDIEADRRYYVEKHKQENENILNNRAVVGKTAAFIPLCVIIACELIIPFVVAGLQQLQSFSTNL